MVISAPKVTIKVTITDLGTTSLTKVTKAKGVKVVVIARATTKEIKEDSKVIEGIQATNGLKEVTRTKVVNGLKEVTKDKGTKGEINGIKVDIQTKVPKVLPLRECTIIEVMDHPDSTSHLTTKRAFLQYLKRIPTRQ